MYGWYLMGRHDAEADLLGVHDAVSGDEDPLLAEDGAPAGVLVERALARHLQGDLVRPFSLS